MTEDTDGYLSLDSIERSHHTNVNVKLPATRLAAVDQDGEFKMNSPFELQSDLRNLSLSLGCTVVDLGEKEQVVVLRLRSSMVPSGGGWERRRCAYAPRSHFTIVARVLNPQI